MSLLAVVNTICLSSYTVLKAIKYFNKCGVTICVMKNDEDVEESTA